jgi:ribosome-binding protein aMBF1 (putative translation factor)
MGVNPVRDTLLGLQQAQIEREKQLRETERDVAERVVRAHAEHEGWSDEDLEMVIAALGLD